LQDKSEKDLKMKMFVQLLLLSTLSFQLFAATEHKIPEKMLAHYLQLSGINDMIESIPAQIEASAKQQHLTATETEAKSHENSVQTLLSAWNTDDIKQSVQDYIQAHSNKEEIAALIAWQEEPLTRKIGAEELVSTSPQFESGFLRYIADLEGNPPSNETKQAIQRFVAATHMTDMMIDMSVQVVKAMMIAEARSSSTDTVEVEAEIDQQISATIEAMRSSVEQQAILMSYYIYRNISNEELATYSAFYETELGARELALVTESLTEALSYWAGKSAFALAESRKNIK
jgi:flagellar motor protein MotB